MAWWLWMGVGITTVTLTLFLFLVSIANHVDVQLRARNQAVRQQQRRGEQEMQHLLQDTINKMFEATRGDR